MNGISKSELKMQNLGISKNELDNLVPDFMEVKNNFIYGEVYNQGKLHSKLRELITITVLTTLEADDLKKHIKIALKSQCTPEEIKEVFHQCAPYIGFPKAESGIRIMTEVFETEGIPLPLESYSAVSEDTRLEKGINAQKAIFGNMIDEMRANAPDDQKFIQDYLSAYCFGDTYTRNGLDLKEREIITFVCIATLGGCEPQLKAHTIGNLAVGNDKEIMLGVMNQCLPYIGFPRTLNAIAIINEVMK